MSERRPDDATDEDRSPGGESTLSVLLALGANALVEVLEPVAGLRSRPGGRVLDRHGFQLVDGDTREGSARER